MKVNDKVVCIEGFPEYGLIKGDEYIITDSKKCSCGEVTVSYGVVHPSSGYLSCAKCFSGLTNSIPEYYCRSKRFRKIDPDTKSISTEASRTLVRTLTLGDDLGVEADKYLEEERVLTLDAEI